MVHFFILMFQEAWMECSRIFKSGYTCALRTITLGTTRVSKIQKMSRILVMRHKNCPDMFCPKFAFWWLFWSKHQDIIQFKMKSIMVQKLKLRYKSPDIKTVCIKLLFCFKNVQIIFEKCPGSRILPFRNSGCA